MKEKYEQMLGELDDKIVSEVFDERAKRMKTPAEKQAARPARILRRAWLIPAAALLIVAAILVPTLMMMDQRSEQTSAPVVNETTVEDGKSNDEKTEKIVFPPVREGAETMKLSFIKSFNFEESIEDSDLIAVVQIGNWLREDPDLQSTYYEAVVKDCPKGDLSGTIVLKQSGYSEATIKNHPLYTYGDVIFAFMKYDPVERSYWIIGEHLTVFTVAYSRDGAAYLLYKQTYGLSETMKMTDYCGNTGLRKELAANEVLTDPNATERVYRYPHIYSYNDVREAIVNHEG